jgi:hypothetical protein
MNGEDVYVLDTFGKEACLREKPPVIQYLSDRYNQGEPLRVADLVREGKVLGMTEGAVRGVTSMMVDAGGLVRVDRGVYQVSPDHDRTKPLRIRPQKPRKKRSGKEPKYVDRAVDGTVLRSRVPGVCRSKPKKGKALDESRRKAGTVSKSLQREVESLLDRYKIIDVQFATELAGLLADVRDGKVK